MNQDQRLSLLRTILITAGVSWLAKAGLDTTTATSIMSAVAALLMAVGAAAWGVYAKRNTGLISSAASVPNTTIVTTAEIAKATPAQANIVSADTHEVAAK